MRSSKPKIYLSSTFEDLANHRDSVRTELERAGHEVVSMERYAAFPEPPLERCLADVADCDAYVLALAHRYGYQPTDAMGNPGPSITQLEYQQAIACKKPVFAFCVDENLPWPPKLIDRGEPAEKLAEFRALVEQVHGRRLFKNPDHLASQVLSALSAHTWREGPVPNAADALLEPPTIRDAVGRPSVSRSLDEALDAHAIVVIGGLSGSGKTTIAASHLARAEVPTRYKRILWHDPTAGESLDSLLALLRESIRLPGEATESRCKALASHLRSSNSILVIDNFQIVDQASYAALLRAVSVSSTPCRLLLLSQTYVSLERFASDPHHIQMPGLGAVEAQELLVRKGLRELDEQLLDELVQKTGGLAFAVSLFALLVVDFNHDPIDLLTGTMESASRVRSWFDTVHASLDTDTRRLLSYLCLLDTPFNLGVVQAVGRDLSLPATIDSFERLQRRFMVTRHTLYRWSIHELLRTLVQPLLPDGERDRGHRMLGRHFMRGISRKPSAILSNDEFLAKVRGFRHLVRCKEEGDQALEVLEQLSSTAKAQGFYALFLELSWEPVSNSPRQRPWLTYHHAHCALIVGKADWCRRLMEPLLYEPAVVSNPVMRISFTRVYAEALGSLKQETQAIAVLEEALSAADPTVIGKIPFTQARSALCWLLARVGRVDRALEIAIALLADAERRKDIRGGAVGWGRLGAAQAAQGQWDSAAAAFKSSAAMFEQSRDRRGMAWALWGLAECLVMGGKSPEAERSARDAAAISASIAECGVDLQERLERMLGTKPHATLAVMLDGELNRIRHQLANRLPWPA